MMKSTSTARRPRCAGCHRRCALVGWRVMLYRGDGVAHAVLWLVLPAAVRSPVPFLRSAAAAEGLLWRCRRACAECLQTAALRVGRCGAPLGDGSVRMHATARSGVSIVDKDTTAWARRRVRRLAAAKR